MAKLLALSILVNFFSGTSLVRTRYTALTGILNIELRGSAICVSALL
jgi:hypothetical protein